MQQVSPNTLGRLPMRRQAVFWMLTIPHAHFTPYLPASCKWIAGQLELGASGSEFLHWQVVVAFSKKVSLHGVRECFGDFHAEPTRSSAANDYIGKDDTAVAGTRFELGAKPFLRNSKTDWEQVWAAAVRGVYSTIPANVRVINYRTLKQITLDHSKPQPMERVCEVFWGDTQTGKSRRARSLCRTDPYPKEPRTKFWCGYQNEEDVVIDEFRGDIDLSYLLRWTDRYSLRLETKHGGCVANFRRIFITSNKDPKDWYPTADEATLEALWRRLRITHFQRTPLGIVETVTEPRSFPE